MAWSAGTPSIYLAPSDRPVAFGELARVLKRGETLRPTDPRWRTPHPARPPADYPCTRSGKIGRSWRSDNA